MKKKFVSSICGGLNENGSWAHLFDLGPHLVELFYKD